MDEKIIQFIKSCAYDYDCDNDAHRYGTACRACEAKKLLKTINGRECDGWEGDLTNQL